MSLLQNIVTQVVQNAIANNANPKIDSANQAPAGGLGGLLGSVLGGAQAQNANANNQAGGLGGLLGSVLDSQGGSQSGGLESVLGGLLGGKAQAQNNASAADLGGLLGGLLGGVGNRSAAGGLGGALGGNKSALLLALLPVVLSFIQQNGGLSGVLSKFNNSGLGNKAQSWVNIDTDNDGIDAGDVARLFGDDKINEVCQSTGASQDEVCQGIAELLPEVMNELTPQGGLQNEQEANAEVAQILSQINGKL
ncbi:hypothetical protein B0181_09750 [Moraxella caviae]|uniref:Uncharacterized protein conserved in bacteria n=1 Tax=Moraxella caviae TaxID=34060 RepID=A0A1S9ZWG7_9GAMM|nr:YidB family protein [Moraxella caviae]OOR87729.1 hypothetical protein B0181_09750 [Moraxella caviae]STZ10142.1 Uncharacterized protein conserved in bacteria [Moraxella caviae]